MFQKISPLFRKSFIAAAALAIGSTAVCTYVARADDKKNSDEKKTVADEPQVVKELMHKMKTEAGEPAHAEAMKKRMAKMMVMHQMAVNLSKEAEFKKESAVLTHDADTVKIREAAKAMAEDPEQMKKIEDEVVSDPKEMRDVIHQAIAMEMMMPDKPAAKTETPKSIGDTLLDKVRDKK